MPPVLDLEYREVPPPPDLPEPPKGPRGLSIAEVIALPFLYSAVLVAVSGLVTALAHDRDWAAGVFGSLLVGQLVAGPVTLALGIRWSGLSAADALRLRRFPLRVVPALVLGCLGASILLTEAASLIPGWRRFRDLLGSSVMEGPAFLAVLAAVVAAPFFEELLCRGVLLRGLLRRHSAWTAATVTALVFMAFHMNPYQGIVALPLGFAFAWLALRTGSVLPGMLGHATVNSASMLVVALYLATGHTTREIMRMQHTPAPVLAAGALAAAIGGATVWWQLRDYGPAAEPYAGLPRPARSWDLAFGHTFFTFLGAIALLAIVIPGSRRVWRDASLPASKVAELAGCYALDMPRAVAEEMFPGAPAPVRIRLSTTRYRLGQEYPARYLVQRLDAAAAPAAHGQSRQQPVDSTLVFWIPRRAGRVSVVGTETLLRLQADPKGLIGTATDYGAAGLAPGANAGAVTARRIQCAAEGAAG